jgi:hypothetical protein
MSKKVFFKPKKVAVAVAATLLSTAAIGGLLAVLETNFIVDNPSDNDGLDGTTYIYKDATKSGDYIGYIVIDEAEEVFAPGIAVYDEGYRSGEIQFAGCVMAKKDPFLADKCRLTPDSGKRFKLRASQLNQPIDIELTVATVNQLDTLLYNVYGKFTNDTGSLATGFKVEIGKGIGDAFVPSTATDGLALKPIQDFMGKFPGGLFGGSPAEGLPFFSLESAYFGWTQEGDKLTSSGMPTQYSELFGAWMTEANVPVAWFLDIDGKPWTDDKLQAWEQDGTWYTFEKSWKTDNVGILLEPFAEEGDGVDLALLNDPNATFTTAEGQTFNLIELNPLNNVYVDLNVLAEWMNSPEQANLTGDSAIRTQEVVDQLLKSLVLTKKEVLATTLQTFAANPVTVRYSTADNLDSPTPDEAAALNMPVVATWRTDCGDEGLYVLEPAYEANPAFAGLVEDDACGKVVEADEMSTVVKDNTSAQTDFFGIPGFSQGTIEDLSNNNTFYAIEVDPTASPTGVTNLTMRITMTDTDPVTPPPPPPSNGGGGGCAIGGDGRFDPTLPALAAAGLVFFGLRRFKASK